MGAFFTGFPPLITFHSHYVPFSSIPLSQAVAMPRNGDPLKHERTSQTATTGGKNDEEKKRVRWEIKTRSV